jgi:hypothetical protein
VGRKVGRDGGAAMNALIAEMQTELEALTTDAPATARARAAALEAVGALRAATTSLLQSYRQDTEQVLAVAVPYLMLCGLAIGGWLMAKSYDIATRQVAADSEFYRSKQQIARSYLEHVLPESLALARIVTNSAASIVEADPALL